MENRSVPAPAGESAPADGREPRPEPGPAPALPPAPGAVAVAATTAAALAAVPLAAWLELGGAGLVAGGTAYSVLLLLAGKVLWRGPRARAGGVLVAAAAAMVPFTLHGATHAIRWFPTTTAPPQDLAALLAAPGFVSDVAAVLAFAVASWRFPYPPLAALLALSAWIAAMDAAPLAFGAAISWDQRALVSLLVGVTAISLGVAHDRRLYREHAAWLYRAGVAGTAFGLVTLAPAGTAAGLVHLALEAALVGFGILVRRRAFAVAGALAVAVDAGRLAAAFVRGAPLVAFAAAVGLVVLAAAAAWPSLEAPLGSALREALPRSLVSLLPPPAERDARR